MKDIDVLERMGELIEEARDEPPRTWWLSFSDADRPKGQRFLGVILVDDCRSLPEAMIRVGRLNPGGAIQSVGFLLDDIPPDAREVMAKTPRLVLLSRVDLEQLGHELDNPS